MSQAAWLDRTVPIRVSKDTKAELEAIQRQFREEHGGKITVDEVIARLLADRRAWRAMGEAAREDSRKPVPS